MIRTATVAASFALAAFMSQAAHAGQPAAAGAPSAGATATPAAAASADKVYPPLPTLAMLPPSTGDDDEPLAPKPVARKRKVRAAVDLRPTAPAARLVVSDTSRTYLRSVDKQLDLALAR